MKTNGLHYAVIAAISIGVAIVVNKAILNTQINPYEYVAWMFIFATASSAVVYHQHLPGIFKLQSSDIKKLAITGILTFGIAQILNILGQAKTSAINAGFLSTLSALFTIPFARLLVDEKIPRKKIKYIALLFCGIYVLSVGLNGFVMKPGDILLVASTIILGFSNAYVKLLGKTIAFQKITLAQLSFGSLFLYVIMFIQTGTWLPASHMWGVYAITGILSMIIASSIFKAITMSGPIKAMLLIETYPVVALAGSLLLLGETVSSTQIIGGFLIMVGVYKFINK